MALPMLDAMIPAATAASKTPLGQAKRLGFVFMPMGCDESRWTPGSEGDLSQLSPILQSLEPVKDQLSVLTNMELANAYPGSHATSNSSFLSAAKARHTEGNDYTWATVDQVAAKQLGHHTQLPSLELSMDLMQTVVSATMAMPACIKTTFPGRRPPRHCQLRHILAWSLSLSLAMVEARRSDRQP